MTSALEAAVRAGSIMGVVEQIARLDADQSLAPFAGHHSATGERYQPPSANRFIPARLSIFIHENVI